MSDEKIEGFNKASLVSLKAELIRKREEVCLQPAHKPRNGLRLKNQDDVNNSKQNDESGDKPLEDLTSEEKDLENLAKTILTAKSQIYDKLCNEELAVDNAQNFLVDFDTKKNTLLTNEKQEKINDVHEVSHNCNNETDDGDDDGWVDYVDTFGRTRRCLRKDLRFYERIDQRLNNSSRNDNTVQNKKEVEENEEFRSWSMARESLRKKWEQQEQLLTEKSDVHYADILFDEARQHGTAFYKFSANEEERRRQQDELLKLRKETEERQENYKQIKQRRETMLKARIDAAKKRKRIRLGLPEEEEEKPNETQQEENEDRQQNNDIHNLDEMNEKILENLEKIRRLTHVRPWDIGKEGVSTLKVMSQEEWNETKRQERSAEFAPPSMNNAKYVVDSRIEYTEHENENLKRLIQEEDIEKADRNENASYDTNIDLRKSNPLCFTTKRNNKSENRSKSHLQQPTPIKYEDSDENDEHTKISASETINSNFSNRQGVEIPPPLSYNDTDNIRKRKIHKTSNMGESIEAGLKFLKHKAEINEKKREKGLLHL